MRGVKIKKGQPLTLTLNLHMNLPYCFIIILAACAAMFLKVLKRVSPLH